MELCARIQKRTGETHESVEKTISPFSKTAAVIDPSSSRIAIYGKSWAIYAMKLTAFESIVPPLLRPEPGRSGSTGVQK